MIKEQLTQARDLIKQQRYDDARAILHTLEHPTAQQWLKKLNQLAPAETHSSPAEEGETKPPTDTQRIKAQLLEARDLIMQKNYDGARALLEHIEHPTARDWLGKLTMLVTAQTAPANITTRTLPPASANPLAAHDDILLQAQEALLQDKYDQARALLEPLQTPEAAFWLEKTGMTRFRTYENVWLDMFRYALPPKAQQNPKTWTCSTCGRSADQALSCPQRDQNPCPVKISTRSIEEPRRLALLLQALYLDQHSDVEKIMKHIDPARLDHWRRELIWQLANMHPVDVRRGIVEEAIPLIDQEVKARPAAVQPTPPPRVPPALQPVHLDMRAAPDNRDIPTLPVSPARRAATPEEQSRLAQIINAIIRFFINQ